MPNCIVLGCPHKCGKKDKFPGVIMHAFPRSLDRIKAWLLQTGQMFEDLEGLAQRIYDGKKNSAHRLCSAHFTIDCYIVNKTNKVLRPDALPSIFPPPGFYHGRKRARKQRKNKDSGQLSSSLHHMVWQNSPGEKAWTEGGYFFQGAETQTELSCFDARERLHYDRSVSDKEFQQRLRERSRLFEHSMPDAPQSLLAGLKEEQVQYPCAEHEYGFLPEPQENPRLLTEIKTENVDEHPVNEHEDTIRRIVIDSPKEEASHLMLPALEDKINSRCLLEAEEMPKCVVKGCPHFSGRKKSTIVSLHMFPKDLTTIKKWLLQTKQDFGDLDLFALGILKGTMGILWICSAHFAPECFTLVGSQKVLLEGAIPTIFPERDKPPNKNKAVVTPVCQSIYMPRSVSANDLSVVSNITSWGINQLIIPVIKINQDNNMITSDSEVNSDMSSAEYSPEVWPSDPRSQPTDVGNCPYPSCDNTNIPTDLSEVTITETSPMLPEWSSEKMHKAAQWPVYENNVEAESWKVMHDHFYRAPYSDNYEDPKRCLPTTEYIGSDGLGRFFEDTHSENELFSMLQNVANIFTMNKNKDLRSKRILNQALEIVSLIAGEEWVIVNKNSIHQGVHQLTGEFPAKCGDVAVYFTVDEWSYIDQHKEDYSDFVTDDVPMNRTWEVPKYWDSDPMTEHDKDDDDYDDDDDMEDIPKKETSSDWEPDSECDSEAEKEIDEEPSKSPERPYKCEMCEEAFLDSEALETHKITHVEKCEDCEEQFSSKAELIKHWAENHAVKRYACTICGIQYDYKSQFIIHQRAHTGEKPFECKECGKKFGHKSSLLVHQRRHTEGKTFECSKCDKRFDKRCEMLRHEKIHTKKKQYKCQKCGKTFGNKAHYNKHKSSVKSCEMSSCDEIYNRKKFKCRKCGKRFVLKGAYEKHKWTHDGED